MSIHISCILALMTCLAAAARADLQPARTIEGSPVYVVTGFPTVADLAGLTNKTPAPIFVVRSDWPRTAELARLNHFGAPATLVIAVKHYPKAADGLILVHAPPSWRIILACDRLPTAAEATDLKHVGRPVEILVPATLGGGLDALLKDVPKVVAFKGRAALKIGLLRAAGIRPTAPLGRERP